MAQQLLPTRVGRKQMGKTTQAACLRWLSDGAPCLLVVERGGKLTMYRHVDIEASGDATGLALGRKDDAPQLKSPAGISTPAPLGHTQSAAAPTPAAASVTTKKEELSDMPPPAKRPTAKGRGTQLTLMGKPAILKPLPGEEDPEAAAMNGLLANDQGSPQAAKPAHNGTARGKRLGSTARGQPTERQPASVREGKADENKEAEAETEASEPPAAPVRRSARQRSTRVTWTQGNCVFNYTNPLAFPSLYHPSLLPFSLHLNQYSTLREDDLPSARDIEAVDNQEKMELDEKSTEAAQLQSTGASILAPQESKAKTGRKNVQTSIAAMYGRPRPTQRRRSQAESQQVKDDESNLQAANAAEAVTVASSEPPLKRPALGGISRFFQAKTAQTNKNESDAAASTPAHVQPAASSESESATDAEGTRADHVAKRSAPAILPFLSRQPSNGGLAKPKSGLEGRETADTHDLQLKVGTRLFAAPGSSRSDI